MTALVIPFPRSAPKLTQQAPLPDARPVDDVGSALADLRVALSDQRRALSEWRFALTELSVGVADLGFALEGYQQGLDDAKKRLGGLRDEATRLGAWAVATG